MLTRLTLPSAIVLLLGVGLACGPGPASAQTPDTRAILPQLTGLRIIDTPDQLVKTGFGKTGLTIDGAWLLDWPGVYQQLQRLIGKPFSQASMAKITSIVTDWYRIHDRPFVDVSFPEQDISNGTVQVLVTEKRLGHIRVTGNDWYSSGLIASQISVKPGAPIDLTTLNQDISRLNLSPYRQVKVVAEPGTSAGTTDLEIQTTDRVPFHIFTGYANNGLPALGRNNFSAGFEWANAFWSDQDLSYQFTSSDNFWQYPGNILIKPGGATLQEHQLTYTVPLPWSDRFIVFGNYAEARPLLGPFLAQTGINWQVSARYDVSLQQTQWFNQDLQFGFDFKRSNNNLTFGGYAVSQNFTDIEQFPIIYNAGRADKWGRTILTAEVVLSPGGLSSGNTNAAFQPGAGGAQSGVPYAQASYVYANTNVTRLTQLPFNMSWILKATTQVSTSNLLSSEQLGIGGVETVRGYDERVANGPMGAIVSSEFRSPPVGIFDSIFGTGIGDKFQADGFWDFGAVDSVKIIPGSQNATILQSAGGGVHYVVGRFVDLRFEYGWQLRKAPGESHQGGEADLSATVGF